MWDADEPVALSGSDLETLDRFGVGLSADFLQQVDDRVSQSSQYLLSRAAANTAGILAQRHITDIMQ